jgi:hypothetical protein
VASAPGSDGDLGVSAAHRIGWLMRINRFYGPEDRFVSGEYFAQAFTQSSPGRGADRAQVSRWERALDPVSYTTLCRYERLLCIEPGRLTATADALYREIHNGGRRFLPRSRDDHPPGDLLDKALGPDPMTGAEWDMLTSRLAASRSHRSQPSAHERAIAQRLVSELAIAENLEWLLRSAAVYRLLKEQRLEAAVVGACADQLSDNSCQVVIELLTILESAATDEAADQIVCSIVRPANQPTFQAAWWAAAEKVSRGHFTNDQLRTLIAQATDVLSDDGHQIGCRIAAAALVRAEPEFASQTALRAVLHRDALARNVFTSLRTTSWDRSDTMIGRLAGSAMSGMPRDVLSDDPMLKRLLDEMLFHPHISRRIMAIHTIEATPYREPVAAALVREFQSRTIRDEITIASPMIQAISSLGQAEHRPVIERLAVDPAAPPELSGPAIAALAHMAGQTSDALWFQLAERPSHSLVYAAGVHRKFAVLRKLRHEPSISPQIRAGAAWWLNLPATVLESTKRPA